MTGIQFWDFFSDESSANEQEINILSNHRESKVIDKEKDILIETRKLTTIFYPQIMKKNFGYFPTRQFSKI